MAGKLGDGAGSGRLDQESITLGMGGRGFRLDG